jgi:hypothetical protein
VLATNETDSGVVVLDRTATPVRTANGQRLELRFRDVPQVLDAASRAQAARTDQTALQAQADRQAAAGRAVEQMQSVVRSAMTPPPEGFAETFRRSMSAPSLSILPSGPLTAPIDLLNLFRSRDILDMSPAEQTRVIERIARTDPAAAQLLRERIARARGGE